MKQVDQRHAYVYQNVCPAATPLLHLQRLEAHRLRGAACGKKNAMKVAFTAPLLLLLLQLLLQR